MKNEPIEKYMIYNRKVIDIKNGVPDSSFPVKTIYEVIRVIDGIPLFLEEHMDRLLKSSVMLNIDVTHIYHNIEADIIKVIDINGKPEKNIKILVSEDIDSQIDYSVFFIKSSYPDPELYEKGINTILYKAVRDNPNAKVQNSELRNKINQILSEKKAYEALLLNMNDEITEGSKSNVFFVKDGVLYTSPNQDVLLGVTRNHVIESAKNLGIEVVEEPVHKSILEKCQGLFITGTSPKVLPISRVDDFEYASAKNDTILKVMNAYDSMIEDYITRQKHQLHQ